jgi:hypothetical protein
MTKCFLLNAIAILSTAIASLASAQAASQQNAYAVHLPHANLVEADVSSPGQTARPWKPGCEMATIPWSAPLGHHQPTAIDVVGTGRQLPLDQEDVRVDRLVRGICRGC